MLTRRDQIHARQFLRKRLHTALTAQKPDPLEWSGSRLPGVTLAAVMILVICVAAVGVYGLINPLGAKSWTSCERIIIEKETGAAYVCDGVRLYPTVNFTSAALLRGVHEDPVRVARASLTWPRGAAVGIVDAPPVLPAAADLLAGAWSFCAAADRDGPRSVLLPGTEVAGDALGDGAVVVTDGKAYHLILSGQRHELRDPEVVRSALAVDSTDVVPVDAAWLATLPAGAPLTKIAIDGRGGAVASLAGAKVGQLYVATDGTAAQRFVARPGGLQPISAVQEALIRATAGDNTPSRPIDQLQLAGVKKMAALDAPNLGDGSVPPMVPAARSGGVVCQIVSDATDDRGIVVGAEVPDFGVATVGDGVAVSGALLADEVAVQPGRGVLVMALASPQATAGPVYLVTETGRRYAVNSADALTLLGYAGAGVVRLPSTLVDRLPQGPVLSKLELAIAAP
ncbi:type VII secretion protein EccB [Hamadaea sp. NPDC050747]|uniref:type VII secretion protein EccB n=1 Tax=Hamadaea sp. NPDC050747 TaxID=3155789 RepID=UPI0034085C9E